MRTAFLVLWIAGLTTYGTYLATTGIWLLLERQRKNERAAGRGEVAEETLRSVLRLQEVSNAGWRTMAEAVAASKRSDSESRGEGSA